MGTENEVKDVPDWGEAMLDALDEAEEGEDGQPLNVVSTTGLPGALTAEEKVAKRAADTGDVPHAVLLKAAASQIKTGELSVADYIKGVKKLDAVADNALKLYAIPAIKTSLPGKLTEYQNQLMSELEAQVHLIKRGLGMMLAYPESQALGDLETGLDIAVKALNDSAIIKKKAQAEHAAILEAEKEEKAQRAQRAAE